MGTRGALTASVQGSKLGDGFALSLSRHCRRGRERERERRERWLASWAGLGGRALPRSASAYKLSLSGVSRAALDPAANEQSKDAKRKNELVRRAFVFGRRRRRRALWRVQSL